MPISRRALISAAAPLTASLLCRPARAASTTPQTVDALRAKLTGALFVPADAGYAAARRGLGPAPLDDRFPALVVQPQGPDDIARALDFARNHSLEISVRSGGHDIFSASTTPSGVVIDLVRLSAIGIDPATGIARAGAGARAGALIAAGDPHGRAAVLGTLGQVGLGGLTLGGGIGYLCGSHGAAVDNLLGVDLVTADGRMVRASARENPDLFWALRGGGGNFGVATAFTYQLAAVPQVYGGVLVFKTDVVKYLRFLAGFLAQSPDALDLVTVIPDAGRAMVVTTVCWAGAPEAGEKAIAALRAYAMPAVDTVKVQSYAGLMAASAPPKIENQVVRAGSFDGLNEAAIDAIAAIVARSQPGAGSIGIMHYMHGALCQPAAGSTPFIRQPGHILYNLAAGWNGAVRPQDKIQWVMDAAEGLRAVNSAQTYINYVSYPGEKPVRDAYGPNYARLSAIKRKYDPQNVFRNNRNIKV